MDNNIEQIRNLNRFYVSYFNRFEKELYQGFPSMNEARIMAYLKFNQSSTATDIQEQLGFDKGQLSKMLTKLEKASLVNRTLNPNDRRHYLLTLTKAGETSHNELAAKARLYLSNAFKDYKPAFLNLIANDMSEIEFLYQQHANIEIRSGNLADLGYIADLHSRIYQSEIKYNEMFHHYVFDSLSKYAKNLTNGCIWIATLNKRRVGAISLVKDDSRIYQLRWFAVDPDFQGLGIGTKLLNTLMEYIAQENISDVYLWTVDELHGARKLYGQAGFQKIESKPNHEWCQREINEEKWVLKN